MPLPQTRPEVAYLKQSTSACPSPCQLPRLALQPGTPALAGERPARDLPLGRALVVEASPEQEHLPQGPFLTVWP